LVDNMPTVKVSMSIQINMEIDSDGIKCFPNLGLSFVNEKLAKTLKKRILSIRTLLETSKFYGASAFGATDN